MNYLLNELNEQNEDCNSLKVPYWKYFVVTAALILSLFLFLYKLFELQIINFGKFVLASNQNYSKEVDVFPERGVIYSRDLEPLVENKPVYELVIDLNKINRYTNYKDLKDVIPLEYLELLSKRNINLSPEKFEEFKQVNKSGRDFFVLHQFESQSEYESLLADISEINDSIEVIKVNPTSYRKYQGSEAFSHILGYTSYVSKDTLQSDTWYSPNSKIGVLGIEFTFEDTLRGEKGKQEKIFSSASSVVNSKLTKNPIAGNSVVTSVDYNLQTVAYESLKEMVKKIEAVGGAVIVQNPNTGEVLSIASYPSFDNNLFSQGIDQVSYSNLTNDNRKPMLNRAISSAFPPASTFKVVTSTAGLQEGGLDTSTVINDSGVITIGDFSYKTWKAGGHGTINVVGALKESSDIFFYVVGGGHADYPQIKGVGPYNLYNYSKLFGFGQVLGIDLPSESPGFVPNPEWKEQTLNEPWFVGNTYHFSIGQGYLTATPLQVNAMIGAIANGGTIYKPYLVSKVVNTQTNEVIKEFSPTEVSKINFNPQTLKSIQEGLVLASAPGGTAYPLFNYKVSVAGKTGTAEFGTPKADGTLPTHAWYTAYAPVEDPQISVTVFIEEGGGGSDNAAPIVKDIFDEYFKDIGEVSTTIAE